MGGLGVGPDNVPAIGSKSVRFLSQSLSERISECYYCSRTVAYQLAYGPGTRARQDGDCFSCQRSPTSSSAQPVVESTLTKASAGLIRSSGHRHRN